MLDYNAIPTAISLYSLEIYVELETKKGLGRLVVEVSSSHTHTHTRTRARTHTHKHTHTHTHTWQDWSEWVISSWQWPLPIQDKNIHAISGIRTRDHSNQKTADLHLRRYDHRDRQSEKYSDWLHFNSGQEIIFLCCLFYTPSLSIDRILRTNIFSLVDRIKWSS